MDVAVRKGLDKTRMVSKLLQLCKGGWKSYADQVKRTDQSTG